MAKLTYEIKVTWAWWLKPYLSSLGLFCTITGFKPDVEKAAAISMKAMRLNGKPYKVRSNEQR